MSPRAGEEPYVPPPAGRPARRDADAFTALFTALARGVRELAVRAVGPHAAETVVEETFQLVWHRWAEVPTEPEARRAWVFAVARHRILHLIETPVGAPTGDGHGADLPDLCDPTDEHAALDEARRIVGRLPVEEGEAFTLVVWGGLSPDDAAVILGCSAGTLAKRLSRARQLLQGLPVGEGGRDA